VAQLPSPDRAALLDDLKRSPSPIAHALRVRLHDADADGERNRRPRETGRSKDVNGNAAESQTTVSEAREGDEELPATSADHRNGGLGGSPTRVAFAGVAQEGPRAGGGRVVEREREERPDYLYLEHVLAKLSGSIHDPNWQVQRTGVFLPRPSASRYSTRCFRRSRVELIAPCRNGE